MPFWGDMLVPWRVDFWKVGNFRKTPFRKRTVFAPGKGTILNGTFTPWKMNMEPENDGLEDDFPFQLGDF